MKSITNKVVQKKSIMGPVISVFIMVLVVSLLAGLTFLFVSELKTNSLTSANDLSYAVANETGGYINNTGYRLAHYTDLQAHSFVLTTLLNGTSDVNTVIPSNNYTLNASGYIKNTSVVVWSNVKVSYTYSAVDRGAFDAINATEAAGTTIVDYLPLIFLAIIFGALLTLVLRLILPYVNLGQNLGGF